MQFKQLEVFVQVARLGSFSRAADALYLTQPTVSAHIAALEESLGTKLVVRSKREASLTPVGQVLYGHATQILALCQRAEQDVRTASSDVRGPLVIAASSVPAQYLLPSVLPALRTRWPGVFFQVSQSDSSQAAQRIADGSAEVAIIGAMIQKPGCVCLPFLTERLVIAVPDQRAYRDLDGAGLHQLLRSAPYLVREAGSGTRKQSEEFLRGIGIDPQSMELSAQFQSTESILQGVRCGLGIALVSGLAAKDFARGGGILAYDYDSPLLEREFYLFHSASRVLTPAARMLIRELPRVCASSEEEWEP